MKKTKFYLTEKHYNSIMEIIQMNASFEEDNKPFYPWFSENYNTNEQLFEIDIETKPFNITNTSQIIVHKTIEDGKFQ